MRGRIATSVSAQTDWRYGNMRASPVLEPISDVISQRANDANCKPGPEDAEQQHGIRALHKFFVDQMGHKLPSSSRPPFHARNVTPVPPVRLSLQPHTRVATRAWLSRSFMRALRD